MKKLVNYRKLAAWALGPILFSTTLVFSNTAFANAVDEAADACVEAARLIREDDDLEGAIEEANWCMTGLRQLQEEIKLSLLPDELMGFEGGEINNQSVMGMNIVERTYTADGDTINVTLTTAGGGDASGLGALGELTKMFGAAGGMAMGAAGGKKIRIQKRKVTVMEEDGSSVLSVELKSGGTLQAESDDLDTDELTDFLREFPIAELDDAIGQ